MGTGRLPHLGTSNIVPYRPWRCPSLVNVYQFCSSRRWLETRLSDERPGSGTLEARLRRGCPRVPRADWGHVIGHARPSRSLRGRRALSSRGNPCLRKRVGSRSTPHTNGCRSMGIRRCRPINFRQGTCLPQGVGKGNSVHQSTDDPSERNAPWPDCTTRLSDVTPPQPPTSGRLKARRVL